MELKYGFLNGLASPKIGVSERVGLSIPILRNRNYLPFMNTQVDPHVFVGVSSSL
jgi:hypothetical protein